MINKIQPYEIWASKLKINDAVKTLNFGDGVVKGIIEHPDRGNGIFYVIVVKTKSSQLELRTYDLIIPE